MKTILNALVYIAAVGIFGSVMTIVLTSLFVADIGGFQAHPTISTVDHVAKLVFVISALTIAIYSRLLDSKP